MYKNQRYVTSLTDEELFNRYDDINHSLEFNGLRLKTLPEGIVKLQNLQQLDLSNRGRDLNLESAFSQLAKLPKLKMLSLCGMRFSALPDGLGQLNNLEELDLSYNYLALLPNDILQLRNLKRLDLSGNEDLNLDVILRQLAKLPNLMELTLKDLKISLLPESIELMQNLETLYLSDNDLKNLPNNIGKLENLKVLSLEGNNLTTITDDIGKLKNLRTLDMARNELTYLPDSIGDLQNLEVLDINENNLLVLSESIGQLQNINYLDLSSNKNISLPKNLGQLKNLKILDLSSTELETLPDSISELKNLKMIDLKSNPKIKHDAILLQLSNIESLVELDLENSTLKTLPESIGKLKGLEKLNIKHNYLTTLPESIKQLTNLREIDLWFNNFSDEENIRIINIFQNQEIEIIDPRITDMYDIARRLKEYITTDSKATGSDATGNDTIDIQINSIKENLNIRNASLEKLRNIAYIKSMLSRTKNISVELASDIGIDETTVDTLKDYFEIMGAKYKIVDIHPPYAYSNFIEQTQVHTSKIANGDFKELCIDAFKELKLANKEERKAKQYYFIAEDYGNIHLPNVFGDLIPCLAKKNRLKYDDDGILKGSMLKTSNSGLWTDENAVVIDKKTGEKYFGIPENITFIHFTKEKAINYNTYYQEWEDYFSNRSRRTMRRRRRR